MLNSPIEDIKARLDIVEVIGSYIKLQKAGASYRALCPFHSEKSPSFFVSPARQIWHCFGGCSDGGDVFKFVMKIEGVEFGDALRLLAQRAGVELKPLTRESAGWRTERQRLYEICELAAKFFEKQLDGSSTGKDAKKYLLGRGISEENIRKWRLGWAPDTWQGLSDFLVSKGYKNEEIVKAGLAIRKEEVSNIQYPISNIQSYDRFRGRIIFPIFDLNSQTVGFSGRIFQNQKDEEVAKYLNTPNTLLYDKSRLLYGLDKAKLEIRKKDFCILVEGNIDVIMAHQAGSENTVATCGTALTNEQLKILKRYSNNLLAAFDMDIAGEAATKRGIDLAQLLGFNIKIVRLLSGKDPADIILVNKKGWEDGLKTAKSILDFYFEIAFRDADPKTAEGKKKISRILVPALKRIPDKIEQSHWIQEMAKRLGARENDVREELRKVKTENYDIKHKEKIILSQKPRKELLEERLITLLLISKSPQDLEFIKNKKIANLTPKIQEILKKIKENLIKGSKQDAIGLSSELADLFNLFYLKAEIEEIEEKEIVPEIKNCIQELQSLEIKNKLDEISSEIKMAEKEGNSEKIRELAQKFNQLLNDEKKETP